MSDQSDPMIDMIVAGRYRVLKPLGEGGMGQVYLAEHEAIEKKLALKVLRPEYSKKPDIVARFQQEAISASRIKHPNVLDVFDFGRIDNGCFFLAMEFLEGHDLADELVRNRTIEPLRGVKIALQICRALTAAHARGVVHRDLKPENVFIQRTGDGEEIVKIVDFGIAQLRSPEEAAATEPKRRRLTRTGMIFGTPEYMAPEQAGGKNADLRVDIYALGVILYEMYTGAVPFTGETFLQVLTAHLNDSAPPMADMCPDLKASPELQAAIMKALSKSPNDRHATMSDFAAAISATPEARALGGGARSSLAEISTPEPLPDVPATGPGVPTAAQFAAPAPETATPEPVVAPGNVSPTLSHGSPDPSITSVSGTTTAPTDTRPPGGAGTPSGKKSSMPLALGLGGAAVAGILAAVLISRGNADGKATAEPVASTNSMPVSPPVPSPTPTVTPAPQPPSSAEVAPSSGVRLNVETEPTAAVLLKNGFQVCDTTPCEVLATVNETLEFEARKGTLRGKAKVLAQKDQKVRITLAGAGAAKPKNPNNKLCERFDPNLGIKIMAPCN